MNQNFWHELRRVLIAVAVMFILPTVIIASFIEYTAWRLGATWKVADIVDAFLASDDTLAITSSEQFLFVKDEMVRRIRPEIMFTGTSRVAQFRSAMFRPYSFYNVANSVVTWDQFEDLLRRFPDGYHPRVMFFTLDYFMFDPQIVADFANAVARIPDDDSLRGHLAQIKMVVKNVVSRRPSLLFEPARDAFNGGRAIGVPAVLSSQGFRRDGSTQYGVAFRDDYPIPDQQLTFGPALGALPLYYAADLDPKQKSDFEAFVRAAHDRGIELVGITVPIWHGIVERLDGDPRMQSWQKFNSPETRDYFRSIGVHYVDCLKLPGYYTNNAYFIDPLHPTEPADLACVVKMLEENPEIRALIPEVSLDNLRQKLAEDRQHTDHIDLYNYEF